MMSTSAEHMAARGDNDLLQRFAAVAEQEGMANAQSWVAQNMGQLVNQKVDGNQKVSDVFAYAANTRREYVEATPPMPGANLGAVTDDHIRTAVAALLAFQNPEA
jgi:hypothetical protein